MDGRGGPFLQVVCNKKEEVLLIASRNGNGALQFLRRNIGGILVVNWTERDLMHLLVDVNASICWWSSMHPFGVGIVVLVVYIWGGGGVLLVS